MDFADLNTQYARFPEIKREEVQKLVKWIHAQPHLSSDIPEEEAIHFYHACRDLEKAKQLVETNFSMRANSDMFCNLDCERLELQLAMRTAGIFPLPKLTPEGYRVFILKLIDTNVSNYSLADITKLILMILDYSLCEDGIRPGIRIVMDMKGYTMAHVMRMGFQTLRTFLNYIQGAAPIRLVGLHYIHNSSAIHKLMLIMDPLMKKELKSILHMHDDIEEFYKMVPKEILPKDYGGLETETNILTGDFYGKLKSHRKDFMEFEKRHQINKKLRPSKSKSLFNLFGAADKAKKQPGND